MHDIYPSMVLENLYHVYSNHYIYNQNQMYPLKIYNLNWETKRTVLIDKSMIEFKKKIILNSEFKLKLTSYESIDIIELTFRSIVI